ncbi:MAG: MBL fold metallo-hydrolase [Bacteroidetes bacterium]|nr:MAG: MBL fold metallo-hydrolase [Bacteroidota bacterium]PTM13443.1 MAG: MBL fold metallo-hydrolase [Bacteroidota bacterium]
MQRRRFLQSAGLLTGVSLLPQQAWLRGLLLPASELLALRRNISIYTERGGTIACLLTPQSMVVVDTQFPEQASNLLGLLRATNSQPLDLLVNTHHHGDHTAGNIAFKGMVNTHVAHVNSLANQERVARENDKLAETLLPTTTFTDTWSQRVGDETIMLHYLGAGHTNGDALVHFQEANIVHLGDLLFNRRFPYVDKSAGANIGNWIEVLTAARRLFDKDTLYVCGHAGENYPVTASAADLKAMAHFLKMSLRYVKKAKRKGETLEQILAKTTEIPGASEFKGQGVERILNAAWEELS